MAYLSVLQIDKIVVKIKRKNVILKCKFHTVKSLSFDS